MTALQEMEIMEMTFRVAIKQKKVDNTLIEMKLEPFYKVRSRWDNPVTVTYKSKINATC